MSDRYRKHLARRDAEDLRLLGRVVTGTGLACLLLIGGYLAIALVVAR